MTVKLSLIDIQEYEYYDDKLMCFKIIRIYFTYILYLVIL